MSAIDIITYADSIASGGVTETIRIYNGINSPYGSDNTFNDFYYTIYTISDNIDYIRVTAYDIRKNDMYMIMKYEGTWGSWQRVCTTSELTELSLANNWNKTKARVVKNGNVVNIEISATDGTTTSGTTIATLPEGFRPTSSPILVGTTEERYGENMKVQYFCIQSDGQVIIFAQEALRQIKLSASFILD